METESAVLILPLWLRAAKTRVVTDLSSKRRRLACKCRGVWLAATRRCALAIGLLICCAATAQEFELDTNALRQFIGSAEQWAEENLDEDVLSALRETEREQVEQFLRGLELRLRGSNALELAELRNAAKSVLPLLEAHEESEPYAAWLRARLDYLEVAEELRRSTPAPTLPPPKLVPGKPPKPEPAVSTSAGRKAWQQQLARRPWPKAADEMVPKLKPVFERERVPAELVWLAEVESSFNPRARSPVGAAGMFQLMPATAKRFGLRRWPRDQRYQPEPSARAAAQYLRQLHAQFRDWPLAVAAYNAGEGTVQRLLDRHKARSFERIAPHLPAETQMFVPKVEATLRQREGVALAKLRAKGA